jgi:hypothetical protein
MDQSSEENVNPRANPDRGRDGDGFHYCGAGVTRIEALFRASALGARQSP